MRLALLLGLVPALAFGQTLSVTVQNQASQIVRKDNCGGQTKVEWTASVAGANPCSDLVLWAATAPCSAGPDAGTSLGPSVPQSSWSSQGSGTLNVNIDDLPLFDGGVCGDAVDQTVNVCGTYTYASIAVPCSLGSTTVTTNPGATLRYDALPPAAPAITAVNSLDSALSVRVSAPSDALIVNLEIRVAGASAFASAGNFGTDKGGMTIEGLTNGTVYEVRANATDEADNVSGFSAVASGTPEPTAGFWTHYLGDGGKETGGCAAGGGGLLALFVLATAALRSRRKR